MALALCASELIGRRLPGFGIATLHARLIIKVVASGIEYVRARKKQKLLAKDEAESTPAQHFRLYNTEIACRVATPGVSVGLLCASNGGNVHLVEAKATATTGKGVLHLTGQLGGLIKDSAQIALTWVNDNAAALRLSPAAHKAIFLDGWDIHIHIPPCAGPKDGPSVGVTLATSLVSLFSQKKVRADTAMTGEITLGGFLLPVGSIKDKILGAYFSGIKRVILPEKNWWDVLVADKDVPDDMQIIYAKTMKDVLQNALEGGLS